MTVSHINTSLYKAQKTVVITVNVQITQNISLETDAVHFSYLDKENKSKPLLKVNSSGSFFLADNDKQSIGRIFQTTIGGRTMLAYEESGGKHVIGTPFCVDTDVEAYLNAERFIIQKLIDYETIKLDI